MQCSRRERGQLPAVGRERVRRGSWSRCTALRRRFTAVHDHTPGRRRLRDGRARRARLRRRSAAPGPPEPARGTGPPLTYGIRVVPRDRGDRLRAPVLVQLGLGHVPVVRGRIGGDGAPTAARGALRAAGVIVGTAVWAVVAIQGFTGDDIEAARQLRLLRSPSWGWAARRSTDRRGSCDVLEDLYAARTELADLAVGRERLRVFARPPRPPRAEPVGRVAQGRSRAAAAALRRGRGPGGDREPHRGRPRARCATCGPSPTTSTPCRSRPRSTRRGAARRRRDRHAHRRRQLPGLAHPVEEVFAWAVREGATNTLRHSDAAHWTVSVARRDTAVRLEIVNDGAPAPHRARERARRPRRAGAARSPGSATGRSRRRRAVPARSSRSRRRGVIRVLIAEDMHLIRGALVALLSLEADMEVVAELERGDEIVVDRAARCSPTSRCVDIDLPGLDGLTAAEQLLRAAARVPDAGADRHEPARQPAARAAGARARLHHQGRARRHPRRRHPPGRRRRAGHRPRPRRGRARDRRQPAHGPRVRRAARRRRRHLHRARSPRRLSLSPATVRNYLSNAITKVGARNRIDAIRISRDAGWI